MQVTPIEINLKLTNEKVKFEGVSSTNPGKIIAFDYLPPIGEGEGFLGLELLTMSFAGCVSTAIVVILRKMGKNISNYKMRIIGHKKEKPLSLERICFAITVETDNAKDEDLEKAIFQAEQISPVWLALKNNVEVEYQYEIINFNQRSEV